MNIGQTSPFTGLIKYFPMNMPRFSFSAEVLSISDSHLTSSMNFFTSLSYSVPLTNSLTRGCSGANTRYVTPKIVSGLVVNVEISKSESLTLKNISIPLLFPIQFFCIALTLSGHSSSFCKSSSNSSAYAVILKNHCALSSSLTGFLQRQQLPLTTCSFASTVLHVLQKFTFALAL